MKSLPLDVHGDYVALIRAAIGAVDTGHAGPRGKITAFAKECGISRQALWRVLNDGGDRERPSIEVIEKIREALQRRGVNLPPVCVPVRDAKQHQWIELGEVMRARDEGAFDKLLAELSAAKGKRTKR